MAHSLSACSYGCHARWDAKPFRDFSHGTVCVVITNKPSAGNTACVTITWYLTVGEK